MRLGTSDFLALVVPFSRWQIPHSLHNFRTSLCMPFYKLLFEEVKRSLDPWLRDIMDTRKDCERSSDQVSRYDFHVLRIRWIVLFL